MKRKAQAVLLWLATFLAGILLAHFLHGCWNPSFTVKGAGVFVSDECLDLVDEDHVLEQFERFAKWFPRYANDVKITTQSINSMFPCLYVTYRPNVTITNCKDGNCVHRKVYGKITHSEITVDCTSTKCGGVLEHELVHAIEDWILGGWYSYDHSTELWIDAYYNYQREVQCSAY